MQNRHEFLKLRRFCREQGFNQRLYARTKSGRLRRFRQYPNEGQPKQVTSRHFIFLDAERGLMVHCPRSNDERTKSLETFIDAIVQREGDMPEVVALLRSMRGIKRGKNVFWYCENAPTDAVSYVDYLQNIADEMAGEYA